MKVRDFGHFDAPLVLFGGAYANLRALKALAEVAGDAPVVSTGDLVGCAAEPAETVALFRALGWQSIAGDFDRRIASDTDADDFDNGFEGDAPDEALTKAWCSGARAAIGAENRAWMADLPDIGTFVQHGRRYAVVHGGAQDSARLIWPNTADADFAEEIAAVESRVGTVDGIVAGHSVIAFHRVVGAHRWINAGAVGVPPHDGRPETRYAVLNDGDVVIHRLSYDHEAAAEAVASAGLARGYGTTLTSGIWPSEHILPPELRR